MADWTTLPDSSLEPGKPIRSIDGLALRDNPIAIAEGAAGAPRIASDLAINWGGGGVGTTSATTWVLNRTASAIAGAVGTYAVALQQGSAPVSLQFGDTIAGSSLRTIDTAFSVSDTISTTTTLSGTWRCMSRCFMTSNQSGLWQTGPALWLRIS